MCSATFNGEFKLCELSNSAKYFTTFVNTDNYKQYVKSYGKDWKPFSYDKKLQDSVRENNELAKTTNAEVTKVKIYIIFQQCWKIAMKRYL